MIQSALTVGTGFVSIIFFGYFFIAFIDPASQVYGQIIGVVFFALLLMLTLFQKEEDKEETT
jgi:TctA family transporter